MTYFSSPTAWRLPLEAFRHSLAEMAIDGVRHKEGVAMWLGRYEADIAVVTHVAVLRGPGVYKAADQLFISSGVMNELTDVAIETKTILIGQVHSHGPLYGTWLSETDKKYGIAVPGYLSAVAPDYALRPDTRIHDCGFHLFEAGAGWRRLASDEVERRIQVTEATDIPVLTVTSHG